MRKSLSAVAVVVGTASVTAVAFAGGTGDTYTTTAKAGSGGSASKPVPVSASFHFDAAGAGGGRPVTPKEVNFIWEGIKENGASFPKCTAAEIDVAQSDSVCPKGSLVATGVIEAILGPEGNRTSNVGCVKQLKLYNSGKGRTTLFPTGDPSKCAGVGYQPPIDMPWKTVKGARQLRLPFPENISHPLPGIEGAFASLELKLKKMTVKKKGKKIGYLESKGCAKSTRTFTLTIIPESGQNQVVTTSAGKC